MNKAGVLRIIRETGEAFADYMDANFRDLPSLRFEMDEQWQYVGCHADNCATNAASPRILAFTIVRRHETLKTTPAVAAVVESERWSLEGVVEMTAYYLWRKDDAKFEAALAAL